MIARRLPGFAFEREPSMPRDILPRMDIALFVGFAATGPLHQPVAIEDEAQFRAVFGGDAPLVWDAEAGGTLYAYLAPAVRAFFRSGGARCWVVRVADPNTAAYNTYPILGLACARFDASGALVSVGAARIRARAHGRWSDDLRVSAALLSRPLPFTGNPLALSVDPAQVAAGDWLRLTFAASGSPIGEASEDRYVLMYAVEQLISPPSSPLDAVTTALPRRALWFAIHPPLPSPLPGGMVWLQDEDGGESSPIPATLTVSESGDCTLTLATLPSPRPMYGQFVRAEFGSARGWLVVEDVSEENEASSPLGRHLVLHVQGLWPLDSAPPVGGLTARAEVLTFQLLAREGMAYPVSVSDLGFDPSHPRYWGALPTDDQLYRARHANWRNQLPLEAFAQPQAGLWREVSDPRFPLAGLPTPEDEEVFFPLAIPTLPQTYLGVAPTTHDPIKRDGLFNFNRDLFLDGELKEFCVESVLEQANFLRYQHEPAYVPVGIHTLLELDEVTLVAIPDLAHRGWWKKPPLLEAPQQPDIPEEVTETCLPDETPSGFEECAPFVLAPPTLIATEPDETGSYMISWTGDLKSERYVVQEVIALAPKDAVVLYDGREQSITLYRRPHGDYFYRARAFAGDAASTWSNWTKVTVQPQERWQTIPARDYRPQTLLSVQQTLIQLCAARGDCLAVLALPEHYREDDTLLHAAGLRALFVPSRSGRAHTLLQGAGVNSLCYGEGRALTYAALYHPWLIVREASRDSVPRSMPPDGTASGMIAFRAIARGAWIAPANETLRGVVALKPPIRPEAWLDLQNAGVNLIRQEPRGFLPLSADTLATDEDADLRPINVRRLLILLQRLALQQGVQYVFEPNSDSFRRLIQRGFESLMQYLFMRGAFAGARPDTAYRVVVDATVNPPQSIDQGRLIVELRVAPSLPMTFMTVRLVQVGDRALQVQFR
jgi:hypothetical protein